MEQSNLNLTVLFFGTRILPLLDKMFGDDPTVRVGGVGFTTMQCYYNITKNINNVDFNDKLNSLDISQVMND